MSRHKSIEQVSLDLGAYDPEQNYLPQDGELYYWGPVVSATEAEQLTARLLLEVNWKNDIAVMYGKRIVTRRQYAWYADHCYEYRYSGVSRRAELWIPFINELKQLTEQHTGQVYNSCLLNLYPDGDTGMAWHSDDEQELKPNGSIASLSFGASRKFSLKHLSTKEKVELMLHSGELLEMRGVTQHYWQHCVPKTKKVDSPRVNLTFRQMVK